MKYVKQVKELLKDPKKKALTQLGLYVIFFIFVFILLSGGTSTSGNTPRVEIMKSPIEIYANMEGYEYKVTYTNIDKVEIIEGTYYNNTSLLTYNNLKYYYEDSLYIIDNDSYYLSNIQYDITKVFNKNLYSIITELEEESKTTYKDGMIVTNYTIDSNKIYNYLYGGESSYVTLTNIAITEKDNIITNIVIDLSTLNMNLTKLEIEYSNIDNISSLEFNKGNYTYKESL